MTAKIDIGDYKYKFNRDEHMQEIGRKLFPSTELIALSYGCHKRRIVSLKCITPGDRNRDLSRCLVDSFYITYFAELDKYDDYYNIIVLIQRTTNRGIYYRTIKIPGSRPMEQNNFIDFITNRHITEIWLCNGIGTYHGVKAPIREKIESKEKLFEIKEYNLEDMKTCEICGNKYSSMFEEKFCQDCISKMIVENNRKG